MKLDNLSVADLRAATLDIFAQALDHYFGGITDEATDQRLNSDAARLWGLHHRSSRLMAARLRAGCYAFQVSTAAERAAHRRANWSGGVARSFAEADEMDLEFWLAATPQERIRAVALLVQEMRMMGGTGGPAPRLQRTVGGARPRRG